MFALKELLHGLGATSLDCRQDGARLDPRMPRRLSVQHDDRRHRARRCLPADRHEPALGSAARQRAAAQALSAGRVPRRRDRSGARPDLSGRDARRRRRGAECAGARRPCMGRDIAQRQGADAHRRPGRAGAARRRARARRGARDRRSVRPDPRRTGTASTCCTARRRGSAASISVSCPAPAARISPASSTAAARATIELLYLLGADELDFANTGSAFVIYQGHHGDRGAARADVVLPGCAYTEKDATYVNTEGRVQLGRRAVFPPGEAREDWAILRALSGALGRPLPFDSLPELAPADAGRASASSRASTRSCRPNGALSARPARWTRRRSSIRSPDFYRTDPISRASPTMAECSETVRRPRQPRTGTHG